MATEIDCSPVHVRSSCASWYIRGLRLFLITLLTAAPVSLTAQKGSEPEAMTPKPTLTAPELPAATLDDALPTQPMPAPQGLTVPSPEAAAPQPEQTEVIGTALGASDRALEFLRNGGPAIWVIAALSVITLALILWKIWRLALIGAWSRGKAGLAVDLYESGNTDAALTLVRGRRGVRSKVVEKTIHALETLPENRAREEVARVANREISDAGAGLRALELIATIAPLLGLLGTVMGMIAAFQALQQSGNRADPALLAGGIWEALLTTAAGMAVAIPASAALTWFEAVTDRMRRDVEDGATRLFVSVNPKDIKLAAE